MNNLYTYNLTQLKIKIEIETFMITKNIPINEISEYDLFNYCEFNHHICKFQWFEQEIIIIAFIDKLVQINDNKYKPIIIELFQKLIIKLQFIYKKIKTSNNYEDIHSFGYIEYLLSNNDLTKLKPTQQYGFMYLTYYKLYYNISLNHYDNNFIIFDSLMYLSVIIDNNIFNDNILTILYFNLSNENESLINNKRIREI